MTDNRPTVVVAGASGFIGRGLPPVVGDDFDLVGLSRNPAELTGQTLRNYRWRQCDLFSRRQAFNALDGADIAIYLVHSMIPSAALSQGKVADMDLICADNFARAADRHGIDHIVYVGELTGADGHRSDDVEAVLNAYNPTVTTLRAGFVIGPGGAGTEMLVRLVERLPVMLLPTWTSSQVCPIARRDLAELIGYVLANPDETEGSWQVAGRTRTTYRQMLALVAEQAGLDRRFIRTPLDTPWLSAHWISTVTGQPYSLVRPLVQRFRHDLLPQDLRLQKMAGQQPMSVRAAIRQALQAPEPPTEPALPIPATETYPGWGRGDNVNVVRSVQRLVLPRGRTARWVAEEYARWLPRTMGPFIRATVDERGVVRFFLWRLPWPVLVLALDRDISRPDRRLFWIEGGLLVAPFHGDPGARLEFRRVPNQQAVLSAIHQFHPRLPWPIYVLTQARIHHLVMTAFGRHLRRVNRRIESETTGGAPSPEPTAAPST